MTLSRRIYARGDCGDVVAAGDCVDGACARRNRGSRRIGSTGYHFDHLGIACYWIVMLWPSRRPRNGGKNGHGNGNGNGKMVREGGAMSERRGRYSQGRSP